MNTTQMKSGFGGLDSGRQKFLIFAGLTRLGVKVAEVKNFQNFSFNWNISMKVLIDPIIYALTVHALLQI